MMPHLNARLALGSCIALSLSWLVQCTPKARLERQEGKKPLAGFPYTPESTDRRGASPTISSVSGESVSSLGEATYNKYCISCHGAFGDGKGPASLNPHLRPRDFTTANWQRGASDEQIRRVIRIGGKDMGLSSYMPPWSPLLDEARIDALVEKIRSFVPAEDRPSASAGVSTIVEGGQRMGLPSKSRAAYDLYCASCHGPTGQGDGDAAAHLNERPRDFTDRQWQASVSDARIQAVIQEGGVAHGLSSDMPAWGNLFKRSELQALTAFIREFPNTQMPRT